jgi:hypothetical protein
MPALHYKSPLKGTGDATMTQCEICRRCGLSTEANEVRTIDAEHSDEKIIGQLCTSCAEIVDYQAADKPAKAASTAFGGAVRIKAHLTVE